MLINKNCVHAEHRHEADDTLLLEVFRYPQKEQSSFVIAHDILTTVLRRKLMKELCDLNGEPVYDNNKILLLRKIIRDVFNVENHAEMLVKVGIWMESKPSLFEDISHEMFVKITAPRVQ